MMGEVKYTAPIFVLTEHRPPTEHSQYVFQTKSTKGAAI